jgi:hypothetical protein
MIVAEHGKVLCLRELQPLLCELVETLDATRIRYAQGLDGHVA